MTSEQKKITVRVIISAFLFVLSFFSFGETVKFILLSAAYVISGYDVLYEAVSNIIGGKIFDEEFLMTVATVGAFALNEYSEAAAVMIFYKIGELLEEIAEGKSRKSITELMNICPETAHLLKNNEEITVSPSEVKIGEIITVKAGERIPLDGKIVEGSGEINMSSLTGESVPVFKNIGDEVMSGSINLNGVLKIEVKSLYENSTVSKILRLVEKSEESRAESENFITKFAAFYTPTVCISALLLALIPPLLFSQAWRVWINRALAFLVVSCPCALVISVPLAFFCALGAASKNGVLLKGANALEALSRVNTFVFDKTGTLSKGSFEVNAIHPSSISQTQLLDIAAVCESRSNHPIAESIVKAYGKHISKESIGDAEEISGMGVKVEIDGTVYYAGNDKLMQKLNVQWHPCTLSGTVVHIAREGEYLGHITVSDSLKPESADTLTELKRLGIGKTVMLTGDIEKVSNEIGKKVGADEIYSSLLPVQKVEKTEELMKNGCKTAFVGDGINDAPVLVSADVGIAMGNMGSDAAIEAADIVLTDDKLSKLPFVFKLSKRTMKTVRQNIVLSIAVKVGILLLAAFGAADMRLAVVGDVGVMLLAVLNSLKLLKVKRRA